MKASDAKQLYFNAIEQTIPIHVFDCIRNAAVSGYHYIVLDLNNHKITKEHVNWLRIHGYGIEYPEHGTYACENPIKITWL